MTSWVERHLESPALEHCREDMRREEEMLEEREQKEQQVSGSWSLHIGQMELEK